MIARRMILQILAAGRRMRMIGGTHSREAEIDAALNIQYIQTSVRASFIVADEPHDEGGLDAAAGCEFVDDRIRLLE
jgi:hypothetical protein